MMQEFLLVVKMALRLTRLTKYTCGEARELVIDFLHDRPDVGYTNAMNLLEKQYGDPHRLLASYRREIKQMSKIKSGDAVAFRRLFNFLIKCQTMSYSTSKNPLDSPDVICMILSKVPGYLQDRWNIYALRISDVTLLFEHSPSRVSEIEHFEIFSCLRENQFAR